MNIWPNKRIDISIECSYSQLADLLHEYLTTHSAEVAEHDSQVIDGDVTDDSFRFWRKFSAGFGQPILNGAINPTEQQAELKLDFRISLLSSCYFWMACILAGSFGGAMALSSAFSVIDLVVVMIILLSPAVTYLLIRSGFLHEQRTLEREFLEFLNTRYQTTVK